MSYNDFTGNTWFEGYFEDRLAQIEHDLQVWAVRVYFLEDQGTHDALVQKVRVALWRHFSENPEEWAALPRDRWLAYAKATFRWGVTAFHRDGIKWLGLVASDMNCLAEGRDITDDEALSMVYTDHATGGHFAYPREILLAELRIDLEAAVERGLRRLCATQRRDMPKLIADLLDGYMLDETCARYGWTRNRAVTLMRKLRTVFYEEMTGEKKAGYLGSHHPLTDAEKQRIRDLYATGLSYKKVAARVGRSPSAVESVCKRYPPELIAQVRALRKQGLSLAAIARQVGRGKSYIAWLATSELSGESDWPRKHDGDGLAPVPVMR